MSKTNSTKKTTLNQTKKKKATTSSKKTSSTTSKKSTISTNKAKKIEKTISILQDENKLEKEVKKQAKKEIKKTHPLTIFISILVFLIAFVSTFVGTRYLQKNDCFELIGDKTVNIFVNNNYEEPELSSSVKCISFGQNRLTSVYIDEQETTFNDSSCKEEGIYYIVYKTTDFKYKNITRIRTIVVSVLDPNEDGIGD